MKALIFVLGFLFAGCIQAQQPQTLMILLQVKDFQYVLQDTWVVPKALPESIGQDHSEAGALSWKIITADGKIMKSGILADPQNVTGHDIDSGQFITAQARLKESAVMIRVAYDPLMSALLIEKMPEVSLSDVTKLEKQIPATQKLLLNPRIM